MNLEEERKGCIERAEALLAKVQAEGREMTEEEQKAYDTDVARAEEINKILEGQAERAKALKEAQERAQKIRAQVVNPVPSERYSKSETRDMRRFSLGRALRSVMSRGTVDGVEKEVFAEGRKEAAQSGVLFDSRALVIPSHALRAAESASSLNAFENDSLYDSKAYKTIFDMYRDRLILPKLGANVFDGLVGNVKVATHVQNTNYPEIEFLHNETDTGKFLNPELENVELSPKRFASFTAISTQLVMQSSPSVQDFATSNLIKSILVAFERQVFQGPKNKKIVGIVNTDGINVINVAEDNKPTWEDVLKLSSDLTNSDYDLTKAGYAMNAKVMTALMSTLKSTNNYQFILGDAFDGDGLKTLAGFKAAVSGSVDAESLLFGAWDSLYIGQWGGVGIIYDPYTIAKNGQVEVIAEGFFDAQIGNPALFGKLSMKKNGEAA